MSGSDLTAECYRSLVNEFEADTCCKRIRVMILRMKDDPSSSSHEDHFMLLANQLLNETKTFGPYIAEIYERVSDKSYDVALLVCKSMIHHEEMLHSIAANKSLQHSGLIN